MAQFISIVVVLCFACFVLWKLCPNTIAKCGYSIKKVGIPVLTILVGGFWICAFLAYLVDPWYTREYLADPRIGDVYWTKVSRVPDSGYDDEGYIGLMKIISINEDSIEFSVSMEAHTNRKVLLTRRDSIEYSPRTIQITKDMLHTMVGEDIIESIRRK